MAWWNPIDWWTGIDREIERGREIDRQIEEHNRREVERGEWTWEDYERFRERHDWASDAWREDVHRDFWDGAMEGWDRITSPLAEAAATGQRIISGWMILQWLAVLFGLYLVYKYLGGGGSLKKLIG